MSRRLSQFERGVDPRDVADGEDADPDHGFCYRCARPTEEHGLCPRCSHRTGRDGDRVDWADKPGGGRA